ncbi:MAG: 50S ribosomal protein L30 [Candidatus Eisenbacteria bacterium]|nr:50S ribosomal protein L30 [Candidatus Eisenbacteria bacterium]
MGKLKITQVRSAINRVETQKRTVRALGIRRMQQTVIHEDTPQIRGMIAVVRHLVKVEEIA